MADDWKLPTFNLNDINFNASVITLSTGNYSRLTCKFKFIRTLGFYWIQIYQPSVLVVVISWVSFWINRESAPARVTLGIMTVLTMTTLMTTANRQMPKVSYVKAVDVYLVVCYVMVFAALLEYALVSYSNKKKQDINKKRQSSDISDRLPKTVVLAQAPSPPKFPTPFVGLGCGQTLTSVGLTSRKSVTIVDNDIQWSYRKQSSGQQSYCSDRYTTHSSLTAQDPRMDSISVTNNNVQFDFVNSPSSFGRKSGKVKRKLSVDEKVKAMASKVDKYARIIFPTVFGLFNVIYWAVYMKLSDKI